MSSGKAKGKRPAISPAPGSPGPSKKATQEDTSVGEILSAAETETETETASLNTNSLKAARQTKATSFVPVNLEGKDWLKADGQEAMLAAYLGFQNTSDLRKFSISWVCLAAEQYFRGAARGLRKIGPFQLLSKAANKDRLARVEEPETAWPYKDTDSDSRKAFQKKWIVAWSLFKMASNVHVYNANTAEENDRRTKSEQAKFVERHASEFEKLNLTFPSETVEFPSPDLGPLKDTNEGELEVFNRCWEAINNGTTVNQSNFPTWMQTPGEKVPPGLGTISLTFETDNLPPIEVKLLWIRGPKVRRNEETEEAIGQADLKGIGIPSTEQELPWDPQLCVSGYQFRDKLRRFMGCRELGLDLQGLRLKFHDSAEDIDIDQDAMGGSWDNLRGFMSKQTNSNFSLWVKLEPFDTEDPIANIFEDPDIPADIQ